jgi:hypothetical protein
MAGAGHDGDLVVEDHRYSTSAFRRRLRDDVPLRSVNAAADLREGLPWLIPLPRRPSASWDDRTGSYHRPYLDAVGSGVINLIIVGALIHRVSRVRRVPAAFPAG